MSSCSLSVYQWAGRHQDGWNDRFRWFLEFNRYMKLKINNWYLRTGDLWLVSDVGSCGDGVEEIVGHSLEYSLESQGPQAHEDNPPHGCPGLALRLGGIADTCQSTNVILQYLVISHLGRRYCFQTPGEQHPLSSWDPLELTRNINSANKVLSPSATGRNLKVSELKTPSQVICHSQNIDLPIRALPGTSS